MMRHKHIDTQTHPYTGTPIRRHTGTQAHRYAGTQGKMHTITAMHSHRPLVQPSTQQSTHAAINTSILIHPVLHA
eukprot:8164686-Alexandrium_andersonii.AAC.1